MGSCQFPVAGCFWLWNGLLYGSEGGDGDTGGSPWGALGFADEVVRDVDAEDAGALLGKDAGG